jgi:hypothetical protein
MMMQTTHFTLLSSKHFPHELSKHTPHNAFLLARQMELSDTHIMGDATL